MKSENRHIIEKVFVEVNTNSVDLAYRIKDNSRSFLDEFILPVIESVLEKYNMPESIFRIDKLNVAIPVPESGFTNGDLLKTAFMEMFETALQEQLRKEKFSGTEDARQHFNDGESSMKPVDGNREAIFLFFVENGYLPWYGVKDDVTGFVLPDEWKGHLEKEAFVEKIKALISKEEKACTRLCELLPEDSFAELLIKLPGKNLNDTEKEIFSEMVKNADGQERAVMLQLMVRSVETKEPEELLNFLELFFKKPATGKLLKQGVQTRKSVFKLIIGILPVGVKNDKRIKGFLNSFVKNSAAADVFKGSDRLKEKHAEDLQEVEEHGVFAGKSVEKEVYVKNAGLILLHPFFRNLFAVLGILDEDDSLRKDKTYLAVQVLHFVATGDEDFFEGDLILEKFLCDVPLKWPVSQNSLLTSAVKDEVNEMLTEAIKHWPALKNTSPGGLRQMFIARDGKLLQDNKGFKLIVERKAQDVLLEKLTWNISMVKLPWKKSLINVEW